MMACECRTAECCVTPTVKLMCPAGVVHTAQTHNVRVTAANHLDESLLCAAGLLLLHKPLASMPLMLLPPWWLFACLNACIANLLLSCLTACPAVWCMCAPGGLLSGALFQYPGALIMTAVGVAAANLLANPSGALNGMASGMVCSSAGGFCAAFVSRPWHQQDCFCHTCHSHNCKFPV